MAPLTFINASSAHLVPSVILASASPARAHVLHEMKLAFMIAPAELAEEEYQAENADSLVKKLALEKAKKVAERYPDALIVSADTLIVDDSDQKEVVLGKPVDETHAKQILQQLSGKTHKVITALCLYNPLAEHGEEFLVDSEATHVTFKQLTAEEIENYIASGEPMGKSGAYGIQTKARGFVTNIAGNEDNVMGLPINLFKKLLETAGYKILTVDNVC